MLLRRTVSVAARRAPVWNVAIVGSGPAGFYTADQLLKGDPDVRVDIYERLPVPFGLVRYGVAPDHQDVKNVTERFHQIASHERCSYTGNVLIGAPDATDMSAAQLPLAALRERYNAVVLSYGASADRALGVPGEDLDGVYAARHLVEWYNGHPNAATATFNLASCETAVIVGNGNVALDCARLLTATPDELVGSDVAEHAAAEMVRSSLRQVVILGRRGPLQAAFTIKELRELTKRAHAAATLQAPADAFATEVLEFAKKDRARKRIVELMHKIHAPEAADDGGTPSPPAEGQEIRIQLQRAPKAFLPSAASPDSLGAALVSRTELQGPPGPSQPAVAVDGSDYELPCQLAFRAIGYRSMPIEGAPFDERRGLVPNTSGRVDGADDLYVAGWLKRGPTGVVLTNFNDGVETAKHILEDYATGKLGGGTDGADAVKPLLAAQAPPTVDFEGWLRVDAEEQRRGALVRKVREKVVTEAEMLAIACS